MHEIERKFLLTLPAAQIEREAAQTGALKSRRLIQQCYFNTEGWRLRAILPAGGVPLFVFKRKDLRIELAVERDAWDKLASLCGIHEECARGVKHRLPTLKGWTVRIRRSSDISGANVRYHLTLKRKVTMATSIEVESVICETPHDALRAHCGPALRKRRVCIQHAARIWEVDTFTNPELLGSEVVEVELPAEDARLVLPAWVGREVTEDREYKCARMARRIAA